jgi:hypothetical protein
MMKSELDVLNFSSSDYLMNSNGFQIEDQIFQHILGEIFSTLKIDLDTRNL